MRRAERPHISRCPPPRGLRLRTRAAAGFTLLELAVVMAVIGLVAAISMGAFGSAFDGRQAVTASAIGQDIDGALLTFAREHHRLPCPDSTGNAREGDAGGACPPALEIGYVPYESLGLQAPAATARAVYAVYRNAALHADLVVPAVGTPTRVDLQRALVAAAAAGIDANHPFMTGDGAATGAEDCAGNRVLHPAYAVIVPALDRDGDGRTLDGVDASLPASGTCLASSTRASSAMFDDRVVFTGFTTLLGLISRAAP